MIMKTNRGDNNDDNSGRSGGSRSCSFHRMINTAVAFVVSCLVIWPYIYLHLDDSNNGNSNDAAVAMMDTYNSSMAVVPRPRNKTGVLVRTKKKGIDAFSVGNSTSNNNNNNKPKLKTKIRRLNGTNTKQMTIAKNNNGRRGTIKDRERRKSDNTNTNTNNTTKATTRTTTSTTTEKPWFILHIGPQKTATTTIQCGLNQHSRLLAQEDNCYYLGQGCSSIRSRTAIPNGETPFLNRLLINHLTNPIDDDTPLSRKQKEKAAKNGEDKHKHFEEFRQRLEWHKSNGHHVILSSELFGSQMRVDHIHIWKGLKDTLNGFNVRIVLAYRHLFDWIPSNYYQKSVGNELKFASLLDSIEDHLNSWDEVREHYYSQQKRSKHNIPRTPGLANLVDNNDYNKGNVESSGLNSESHISLWLFQKWSQHFDDVRVFDMHQDGYLEKIDDHNNINNISTERNVDDDLAIAFICQMLPMAGKTCQKLRQRQQQHSSNITEINNNNNNSDAFGGEDDTGGDHTSWSIKKLQSKDNVDGNNNKGG